MTFPLGDRPSLEALVESEDLGLEILHPGGLEITRDLAQTCGVARGSRVLEVASGTGETACFLTQTFGAEVTGVDGSPRMVERAQRKAAERGLKARFMEADAHRLPFPDGAFDAVLCECTAYIFDKERAIGEMRRVVNPGGRVGIHDLCWKEGVTEAVRRRLAEIEGERPETLEGWRRCFQRCGLEKVEAQDRSPLIQGWMRENRKRLGLLGRLRIMRKATARWGVFSWATLWESERIFSSKHMGYAIVVGRRP